jgi:hypothetical protein
MAFATSRVPDLSGDGLEDVIGGSGYNVNTVAVMEGTSGDTLWMRPMPGPVETVSFIASIDGDESPEILVGTRTGEIMCLAGGGGVSGVRDPDDRAVTAPIRVWHHPNPFNSTTTIRYRIGFDASANLAIFDVQGRCVRTLVDGMVTAGEHSVIWDGCDEEGVPVAAGVYFSRLQAGGLTDSKKALLIR